MCTHRITEDDRDKVIDVYMIFRNLDLKTVALISNVVDCLSDLLTL